MEMRRKKAPRARCCFHSLLVIYVIFSTTLAFLYISNNVLIPRGLYFTNSNYQTNVNIKFYESKDEIEIPKHQKVTSKGNSKTNDNDEKGDKNEEKGKPGWQYRVKDQNHMYDHPVIRRIDAINVYYLTAVASNTTTGAFWDRVVINGWETVWRDGDFRKYYCCFDTNGQMSISEVYRVNTWGLRYPGVIAAVQFFCNRTVTGPSDKPNRVALTLKPVCRQDALKFVNVDYAFMQTDNTIGVCSKVAYGDFPAERILEWVEINKEMGADHVVLFTYNLTDEAKNIIDHYAKTGFITQREFDFPMKMVYPRHLGQKYTLSWHDEQVTVFDCMERLQGYHYIAVLDLDEFLIPRKEEYYDWKTMLSRFSWNFPYAAGFSFQSQVFTLDWGVSNPDGEFFVSKFINRTKSMWDRRKNIINPQKVVPGSVWTHGFESLPGFRMENISSSLADILHYRSCRSHWIEQGTCLSNRQRFTDDTMLRVIPRVRDRLIALRETLLSPPFNKTHM